jgi:hypothetical protein
MVIVGGRGSRRALNSELAPLRLGRSLALPTLSLPKTSAWQPRFSPPKAPFGFFPHQNLLHNQCKSSDSKIALRTGWK